MVKQSQRDFDRINDRYLDPPDFNDDSEQDEDSAYDIARQRRLEEEDWIARKIERDGEE